MAKTSQVNNDYMARFHAAAEDGDWAGRGLKLVAWNGQPRAVYGPALVPEMDRMLAVEVDDQDYAPRLSLWGRVKKLFGR